MPQPEIVNSVLKCPKCKSNNLLLVEVWIGHTIEWEQIDGKFDMNDGVLEHGGPYRVEARCKKCNHMWKARKATDIHHITK